jgi:anaerobic selenocysteine-containing dehydrogenase
VLRDGRQEEAEWSEAVLAAARGLGRYAPSDAQSLGVLCSGRLANEEAFATQEFARGILGTDNIDNLGRALDGGAIYGLESAICVEYRAPALSAIADSDVILVLNSNLAVESPQAAAWIVRAREGGAKAILLDEVGGGFAAQSDMVLLARPGTLGLAIATLWNMLADEFAPAGGQALDIEGTGLAADELATVARMLRSARRPAIVASASALRRQDAYLVGRLAESLAPHQSDLKNVLQIVRSECNGYGVTLTGVSPLASGSQPRGLGAAEMLAGGVKALLVVDAGLETHVGMEGLRRLREGMEFICAISPLENESAAVADVVLPMSGWGATRGTIAGGDGRVWALAALPAASGGRGLATALADIASAMGKDAPSGELDAVRSRLSAGVTDFRKVEWDAVEAGAPGRLGTGYSEASEDYSDPRSEVIEPIPVTGMTPERPFTLLVRRDGGSWAYDPRVRGAPILERELAPKRAPYAMVGVETVQEYDLRRRGRVVLETAFGKKEVPLRVEKGVPLGIVVVPWHCRDLVFALCGPGEIDPRLGTLCHGPVAAAIVQPGPA